MTIASRSWKRIHVLSKHINSLRSIRQILGDGKDIHVSDMQLRTVEAGLNQLADRLLSGAATCPPDMVSGSYGCNWHEAVGHLELSIARASTTFDTYADVLTQRLSPTIGPFLRGCDVLAADCLSGRVASLKQVSHPIVYIDRGFGASILRTGIPLAAGVLNHVPLIQIPYRKLQEIHNLASVLHEAGHEAMARTGLLGELPNRLIVHLLSKGIRPPVADLMAYWMNEVVPDFWAFCCSSWAQIAGIRDVLSIPSAMVMRINADDPHPTPYIRILLACEWGTRVWGDGPWRELKDDWRLSYPTDQLPLNTQSALQALEETIPHVVEFLIVSRFKRLEGKRIMDLFDMSALSPLSQSTAASEFLHTGQMPPGLRPCHELGVVRHAFDQFNHSPDKFHELALSWLTGLNKHD